MSEVQKDLAELLREHQGGVARREAERLLGELVDAVLEHERAGALTIKIGVKPFGEDGGSVSISIDTTSSPPRPKAGATVFHARQGTLLPFEPELRYQDELPAATVEALAVHSSDEQTDKHERRSA